MLLTPTILSRFMTSFYQFHATQAVSTPPSEEPTTVPTQSLDEKSPQPTHPVPQDEDEEIFDHYLDEMERQVIAEEQRKFAKYCLSFIYIGRDVTQYILKYSTTYDLCAHVRGVNRDFRSLLNTSNGWFAKRLMASRGVADCAQVIRVMMHTYIYGKEIHEKAIRVESHGDKTIFDDVFFGCATRLWMYESSMTHRFADFPTMHEVVMTWCHGLEILSKQFLRLLLARLGMDEENLSAKDRRTLRKMYLEYKKRLVKDGLRMVDAQAQRKWVVGYDWKWLDRLENSDSHERQEDPTYPICYAHPFLNKKVAERRIDPLVMMGLLRNREMSRKFCHLFVDLDDTTPMLMEDLKDLRACLQSYLTEMIVLGQEEDVPFIRALITNVRSARSQVALSPKFVAKRIMNVYEERYIRQRVVILKSNGGFDMDLHLDKKSAQQKLLFARALLPMCLSRIGEGAVRADPKLTRLLEDLEPQGDEDDALKKELKQLFWSCF